MSDIRIRASGADASAPPRPRRDSSQHLSDNAGAGLVTQNAVNRALSRLTIGPIRKVDRSKTARHNMAVKETELQYQLEFSGEATDTIAWATFTLEFDFSFHYAPSARDSDLDRPQFTSGHVIDSGSPVSVTVCVTAWEVNADEATIGATLAVGTCAPGITDQLVPFGGYLHLTFQGYGGVIEDESDI